MIDQGTAQNEKILNRWYTKKNLNYASEKNKKN